MNDMPLPATNVLMIVGSLRERSLNRQLAEHAAGLLDRHVQVSFLDYADLPPMNQDDEVPADPAVQRVRDAVEAADGIWIVSAEYNHGIPGMLKNLIDWLSRPVYEDGASAIEGKIVTYSAAAGSSRARFVLDALKTTLDFVKARTVDVMPTGVALDRAAYTTDTLALSPASQRSMQLQADLLLMYLGYDARRMRTARDIDRAWNEAWETDRWNACETVDPFDACDIEDAYAIPHVWKPAA